MAKKNNGPGAPKKAPDKAKNDLLQLRINPAEKQAFAEAAALDGMTLSAWIRNRLRRLSREELLAHGREVPFLSSQV